MIVGVVPEGKFLFEFFVFVVFDFVEFEVAKFGVKFMDVFDLLCLLCVFLQ
jgi:hypothetical protein